MRTAQPRLSAALIHADPGHLAGECAALAAAGVDAFHVDLGDGRFAATYGLGLGAVEAARGAGRPVEAHCLIEEPGPHIAALAAAGCGAIIVHAEACTHLHRVLGQIRDAGASPGVAILPATPLTRLTYALAMADQVLVLGSEPGGARGALSASAFERVRILRENLDYLENAALLSVEGAMTPEHAARFARLGARGLVLDDTGFFAARGQDHAAALAAFRDAVAAQARVV